MIFRWQRYLTGIKRKLDIQRTDSKSWISKHASAFRYKWQVMSIKKQWSISVGTTA
jgi:hypothetical protein